MFFSLPVDILLLSIVVAANLILGFLIYYNDQKSATSRLFLLLTSSIAIWSVVNFYSYNAPTKDLILISARLVLFFAVVFATSFFLLIHTFPSRNLLISKKNLLIVIILSSITMLLTLTPLVFENIGEGKDSAVAPPVVGPMIILFAAIVAFYDLGGIFLLFRKISKANNQEKKQFKYLIYGFAIMLISILIFNFIFPTFKKDVSLLQFAGVFTLPFVAFTAYAISKHELLHVKVVTPAILIFVLLTATILEIPLSEQPLIIIFRLGVFLLIFSFGILLIKSVLKEVEQRERLEKLTKELEAANVRLTELDKLKSEFLSFASHQVKTPMSVVKGFAQLIYDGTYGPVSDQVKETAIKIKESADKMIGLVNNLLDLRKIEAGEFFKDLKFEDTDIVAFVNGMVEEFRIPATNKGLELKFESDKPLIKIKIDIQKIRQVIQNLIDNAIKYTDKGQIKVTVTDEGELIHSNILQNVGMNSVVIAIEDTGRGMSKEMQKQAFERFTRDERVKKEIQGTGLGLYIAREIVNAHHGEIWAESNGERQGSIFFVRLRKQ